MKRILLSAFIIIHFSQAAAFGQVPFAQPYTVANPFIPRTPTSVMVVDVDKDFKIDIVANNFRYPNGPLIWYENKYDGSFNFRPHLIEDNVTLPGLSVDVADLDGDGDRDILATYESDIVVVWYENFPSIDSFSPAQIISTDAARPKAVKAIDMDHDRDMDVLILTIHGILQWFENTDSQGTFGEAQNLNEDNPNFSESLCLSDLDGDSDNDLILFGQDKTVWYELRNDTAAFSPEKLISDSVKGIYTGCAADIDNDGDDDVIAAGYNNIAVFINSDSRGNFDEIHIVTESAGDIRSVFAADINYDGFKDLLTATVSGEIRWYANSGNGRTYATGKLIYNSTSHAGFVAAADFDSDGDNDVVSAFEADTKGLILQKNLIVETDVNEGEKSPESFSLYQNYPNPFNPSTTIEYSIPAIETLYATSLHVRLVIFDILGRKMATLINKEQLPGKYKVNFEGSDLPGGVYFYRIQYGGITLSKKMILLK